MPKGRSKTKIAVKAFDLELKPHHSLQDVHINEELAYLDLGLLITEHFRLFYCLVCEVCVPADCLRTHLNTKGHRKPTSDARARATFSQVESYGVCPGRPELPTDTIPWLPALGKPVVAYKCQICPSNKHRAIWFSKTRKSVHKTEYHSDLSLDLTGTPITVQRLFPISYTFYNSPPLRVIYSSYSTARQKDTPNAGRSEIFRAYQADLPRRVKPTAMPPSTGYSDTIPLLQTTGWAEQTQGCNRNELVRAVEFPDENDPLHPLAEACVSLFQDHQSRIRLTHPSIRRKWMRGSTAQKIFSVVGEAGAESYSRRMARLVAMILRVENGLEISRTEPAKDGSTKLLMSLTENQATLASKTRGLLSTGGKELHDAIQHLLVACFAPEDQYRLSFNKFNDITQVFCMLAAIDRTGQFSEAKNISSPLAGTQYIMRSVLLIKTLDDAKARNVPIDDLVDQMHAAYLRPDGTTPFGGLQDLKANVWRYIYNSSSLPNVQWCGEDYEEAIVNGKRILLNDMKLLVRKLLAEARRILYDELLLKIPPSEIGWTPERAQELIDDLSNIGAGYSMFSEEKNQEQVGGFEHALLQAFVAHDVAFDYFCDGKHDTWTNKPRFRRDRQKLWLAKWDEFIELLALCMHFLGGQPARITEFLSQTMENTLIRPRHLYWFRDQFMFVMFNSKLTSLTAKDRIIAHGLPPELTDIILVANVLVRPAVAAWVFEQQGMKAYEAQYQDLFSRSGTRLTSKKLGERLETVTKASFGVPLGINDWRHLAVLIMRQYFKVQIDPEHEEENDMLDTQACHTSRVAGEHYAVEEVEWYAPKADTIVRYLRLSRKVSDWFLHSELSSLTFSKGLTVENVSSVEQSRKSLIAGQVVDDDEYVDDEPAEGHVLRKRSARLERRESLKVRKMVVEVVIPVRK